VVLKYGGTFNCKDIIEAFSTKVAKIEAPVKVCLIFPPGDFSACILPSQKDQKVLKRLAGFWNLDLRTPVFSDSETSYNALVQAIIMNSRLKKISQELVDDYNVKESSLKDRSNIVRTLRSMKLKKSGPLDLAEFPKAEAALKGTSDPELIPIPFAIPVDRYVKGILNELKSILNERMSHLAPLSPSFSVNSVFNEFFEKGRWSFLSKWLRDTFWIVNDNRNTNGRKEAWPLILEGWEPTSITNRHVAELISEKQGYHIKSHRYVPPGGNVICTRRHVLIGKNSLSNYAAMNSPHLDPKHTEGEFRKYISNLCGSQNNGQTVQVIGLEKKFNDTPLRIDSSGTKWLTRYARSIKINIFEGSYQPFFHLDLFITPGPIKEGKERIYLGEPQEDWVFRPLQFEKFLSQNRDMKSLENKWFKHLKKVLNQIHDQLERLDYEVVRIPIGFMVDFVSVTPIPFNNALIECLDGISGPNRIFLPHFEFNADYLPPEHIRSSVHFRHRSLWIKTALRDLFKHEFDEIIFMPFTFVPSSKGALRCSVNVLRRTVP